MDIPTRDVPCDGCTACCESPVGVKLFPGIDDIASYRHEEVGDEVLMETDEGGCIYLGEGGCTIYERRPVTCRFFDCRELVQIWPSLPEEIRQERAEECAPILAAGRRLGRN